MEDTTKICETKSTNSKIIKPYSVRTKQFIISKISLKEVQKYTFLFYIHDIHIIQFLAKSKNVSMFFFYRNKIYEI